MTLNPNFVLDKKGRKTSVLLSVKEFESVLRDLEELEDLRLFDKAKRNDDGKRHSISEIKTDLRRRKRK